MNRRLDRIGWYALGRSSLIGVATLLTIAGIPSSAALFTSATCGAGFNIPDGGTLTCDISIAGSGLIPTGNQISVSLIGFQHEASGDLTAFLTHLSLDESVIYGSQPIFYRIGKTSADPGDFGYAAQFGNVSGTGDNYRFRSSLPGDLWGTAAGLGAANYIPGEAAGSPGYWTTGLFNNAPTNFSFLFAGQPQSGIWRLTITDNEAGPTVGSTGSLLQWELTIDDVGSAVPEPHQGTALLLALAAGAVLRRRAGHGGRRALICKE